MDLPHWQVVLVPDEVGDLRALLALAAAEDRVAPWSGHVTDGLAGGAGGRSFLLVYDGEVLTAAAAHFPGDPAEVVVRPIVRGDGLGGRVVASALERAGAVWAHGDLPAARAVAGRLGLQRTRELLQMGRPLAEPGALGPVDLPAGVHLRTFRPGADDGEFLAVNARAFAWHPEQGRLDRAALELEMAQDWFDPAGFLLAVDDSDRILGFHWTKVHPAVAGSAAVGEVYVLAVDPRSPVRRLGRPLTIAGLDHLARRGLRRAMLYVEGDNEPARRIYAALGFAVTATDVVYRPGP